MYLVDSFKDGYVLIVGSGGYSTQFLAGSIDEGKVIALEMNRPEMRQQLADYRFQFETANGLEIGEGVRVLTDRESQAQLGSAYAVLRDELIPDTDWKAATGWERVTLEQIKPIAKAVAAHVRGCFRGERVVQELIDGAKTLEEITAIDVNGRFVEEYNAAFAEVIPVA